MQHSWVTHNAQLSREGPNPETQPKPQIRNDVIWNFEQLSISCVTRNNLEKRQTWGDLVKLSYRPTNLTDSYWESVVLVHSTRGYKTLALVCCMRLWRVQVSSKTELSSQNLSQLVTKLAPQRCYGHPVFVYNTVKSYNIHERAWPFTHHDHLLSS